MTHGAAPLHSTSNSFDFLRFAAASTVLVSHSKPLNGLEDNGYGWLAVMIFFVISGYLITASWERNPEVKRFAVKRVARIFPGLLVVTALTAFVLYPLISERDIAHYFSSGEPYLYVAGGSMGPCAKLSGLFEGNPAHCANGPLWTLPYEMAMYVFLAVMGSLLPRRLLSAAWLALIALFVIGDNINWSNVPYLWRLNEPGTMLSRIFVPGTMSWFCCFALGALAWIYRRYLPLNAYVAVVCVALFFLGWSTYVGLAALTYAIITLGNQPWFAGFSRYGDFSYGMYIYAWPVQQLVVWWGVSVWLNSLALTALLTLLCAVVSWHAVERPALDAAHRHRARRTAQLDTSKSATERAV